jgi:hypothetical protein
LSGNEDFGKRAFYFLRRLLLDVSFFSSPDGDLTAIRDNTFALTTCRRNRRTTRETRYALDLRVRDKAARTGTKGTTGHNEEHEGRKHEHEGGSGTKPK